MADGKAEDACASAVDAKAIKPAPIPMPPTIECYAAPKTGSRMSVGRCLLEVES